MEAESYSTIEGGLARQTFGMTNDSALTRWAALVFVVKNFKPIWKDLADILSNISRNHGVG